MKHLFFLAIFASLAPNMHAQEPARYKQTMEKFTAYYNAGHYDSIWQLCGTQMQQALPLEKTKAFFSGLNASYGSIQSNTYDKTEGAAVFYNTKMINGSLATEVALDDKGKIAGLRMVPEQPKNLPLLNRNTTKLSLPFNGEWTVVWGGDTRELNYHVESRAQKNAFDIVKTGPDGKTYRTNGKANEDYYAFGQPIVAPCDAVVVLAVDGIKDNVPGEENKLYVPGNSVILKTKNNEYLFFAHFKQNSVRVKEGDEVKQGYALGLCGNTGNSSEPHLHFHIQNVENTTVATGAKCYFDNIYVDGTLRADYSPIKGEKISNMP